MAIRVNHSPSYAILKFVNKIIKKMPKKAALREDFAVIMIK